MEVPFLDLKRQHQSIKDEVNEAINRVMESQRFILGDEVESFEKRIAEYCGVKHAVGVASGTDALLLSLRALGIGTGDKVITSPFTFFATAGAIHNIGATPVFVDIKMDTYNIDPQKVEEFLKSKDIKNVKAIVPVHLYGQMADMDYLLEIAEDHDLAVNEDTAQAIGAEYKGKKAGTLGDTGCFSFFPSKNLGGAGDGGMIVTNIEELADKIRTLRVHGSKQKYYHHVVGYNSRLDELQAAILNKKLDYLDRWSGKRRVNAEFYNNKLQLDGIETPFSAENRTHIYNQYTIRTNDRDKLMKFLNDYGIGTAVYYPLPLHLQPCFSHLGYKKGDLPNSERASEEVLSLPIFPELTREEKAYVVERIMEFFNA